ncbi:PhnA-like protein [Methylobacterium sp.]|uniref:PhnA-like protein n=1 Tax=Methylobacterium sp. TaxID=409 RepID=UPI00261F8F3D|nr:PhnA-like protein [Methylobacterium sp.]MDB5647422.1 PhnA-like protein [Methylobacterium sp.]
MALSPTPVSSAEGRTVLVNQVSWGAIFAGAVAALVAQMILNMVGLGIGLSTLNPTGTDTPSASSLSTGAGLWWVGSGIVASLIGGFLAGRLSGKPVGSTSGYHGLISWAVTTLVIVYLLTSAVGGILGGAFGGITSVLGGAGSAIGGTVQTAAQAAAPSLTKVGNPLDGIESKVRQASGNQDPEALRNAAASAVRAYLSGDAAQQAQAEQTATDALAKAQGIPADQAKAQVQDYRKQYEKTVADAKAKAQAAAEATRSAAAQGSLYAALALVLGALAAFLGGRLGTVSPALAYGDRRI